MFGVVRPCRHRLSAQERDRWAGHLCGLCLTLRDRVGHDARLATNYDGLLLSVLVEDIGPGALDHRRAGPCALRGLRPARVVASSAAAVQLAAAVSLLLAATKVADHIADGQSPRALRPLARRWEHAGRHLSADVGLDPEAILGPAASQAELEAMAGRALVDYAAPTAAATAAAFAHAAHVAGQPGARRGLATAGAAFGRLAYLLDAVEDEAGDCKADRFNPLAASRTDRSAARVVADRCVGGLREGLAAAGLAHPTLTHRLLVHEAGHAVLRAFDPRAGRAGPLRCQLVACTTCAETPAPAAGGCRLWRDRCGDCVNCCGSCAECCQAVGDCFKCCECCDCCDCGC